MANGGVIVVVSGQDDTGKVFDAIDKNLKKTSAAAHETEGALAQLGERAKRYLEYAGIALGAHEVISSFKELVSGSLELGEALIKAQEKTGLAIGTLSTLHYAAAVTNSDFDALTGAIAKMGASIGEAADGGSKKAASAFASLGLNVKQLAGQTDGVEVAFKRVAESMAATESPARRLELATAVLGKASREEADLLVRVGGNYEEFKRQAEELGLVLDQKTAKALERTAENLKGFELRIQGAGLAFTEGLLPALNSMLSVLEGGKSDLDNFSKAGASAGHFMAFLGEVVYVAAAAFESLFGAMESLVPGLGDVARKDLDAVTELMKKAQAMHDVAFGGDKPLPDAPPEPKHGKPSTGFDLSGGEDKLDAARKARDAAQLRLDEQMATLRAQLAKAAQDQQLAQLESDHARNLVSDQDFYAKKLAIEKAGLDAQRQAALDKQAEIDKNISSLEADAKKHSGSAEEGAKAIEDQAKILDLRTKRLTLDGEIAKINADGAKAEIDAAQKVYELSVKQTELVDELAAKREALAGGSVEARLHQSADSYDIKRQGLVANFGEGSKELSDADFAFGNEQSHIRATGAEETSGLATAGINAQRTGIQDALDRGSVSTLEAQRERIALDQEEARALGPVLTAYEELAASGDLQATEKVIELKSRIAELNDPVDEVTQHMRESFDGAFESLFENLDQGLKGFESFTRSIEKTLEQAAYKKFLEPLVQQGLGGLFPNKTGNAGGGGYPGVVPFVAPSDPGTDIGGGAVKAAAKLGGLFGIPGLGGDDSKKGRTITITLINDSSLPLDIGKTDSSGSGDKDKILSTIQNSFDEGGLMRTLLTGFGFGGG